MFQDYGNVLFNLYSKFPSLLAQNLKCTRFSWLQRIGNVSFIVQFECPRFPSAKNLKVFGDDQFLFVIKSLDHNISDIVKDAETFEDVLSQMSQFLLDIEDTKQIKRSSINIGSLKTVEIVVEELQKIGLEFVSNVAEDINSVTLKSPEFDRDKLELVVQLPPEYPGPPLSSSNVLPHSWQLPPSITITQLYSHWCTALDYFRPTWRELAELDRLCWILDPEPATAEHLHRRLVLTNAVSLHLELDPGSPLSLPTLKFLGADQKVAPIRDHLAENIQLWDEEDPVLTNLERVLGLELPSRSDPSCSQSDGGGWNIECGICYTYKLNDELPSINCPDEKCCHSYHHSCLVDWLVSLPGCRTTLNMVTGDCLYCSKPIQCPRPIDS